MMGFDVVGLSSRIGITMLGQTRSRW
jgi:hypothetical protein